MCDIVGETIKLLHISDQEMQRRITINGIDIIEKAASEGHPVFYISGHYANWEWAAEVTRRIKAPEKCCYIYAPLANKTFDRIMLDIRSFYNIQLIPKKQAARTALTLKRQIDSYFIGFI